VQRGKFNLFTTILDSLKNNRTNIKNGDILVISSKYVSNSQNRLIHNKKVRPSRAGNELSKKYNIDSKLAELIIRESDKVLGGITGVVLASANNFLAPNAGIDQSNSKEEYFILYPQSPETIAEQLKRKVFMEFFLHVGIIIIDSRLMPSRIGTTGVALACAGIEPIMDLRGKKDLNGNPLMVTFKAIADNLASIANHEMGEAAEGKPFAIIRDSGLKIIDRTAKPTEFTVPYNRCLYVRGLRN